MPRQSYIPSPLGAHRLCKRGFEILGAACSLGRAEMWNVPGPGASGVLKAVLVANAPSKLHTISTRCASTLQTGFGDFRGSMQVGACRNVECPWPWGKWGPESGACGQCRV